MFETVLTFWFNETSPLQWWKVDAAFDKAVRERFGALHRAARLGELWEWRQQPRGRLAEIIVLDQFPRNMYRGTPQAFAGDEERVELVVGGREVPVDRLRQQLL